MDSPTTSAWEVVLQANALLGEGPLWDERSQRLLWVDILQNRIGVLNPHDRSNRVLPLNSAVGAVVPTEDGNLLAAVREGFVRVCVETAAISTPRIPRGHDPATVRFNDGKCDPEGRFWAGTMSHDGSGNSGVLYSLETDGSIQARHAPVGISNGIAWSLDGTRMYYIDTPQRCLTEFVYDRASGSLSQPRRAIEFAPELGWPDGMTIDAEGHVWIAFWDGGAVSRWDTSSGHKLQEYRLPVTRVTACAFGGASLDTLYVTSARLGLTDRELAEQPLAGSIFAIPTPFHGTPAFRYRGESRFFRARSADPA